MNDEKILKELKELKELNKNILKQKKEEIKILSSIRTFIIAGDQLTKTLVLELQKQGREIKNIKSFMEEKWQQASEQNHSEPSHQKPQ